MTRSLNPVSSLNVFRSLKELFTQPPLLVAVVSTVNGDGTSTVTFPGGGQQRVRGTSVSAGNQAFVQAGEIRGQAPSLTSLTIEV